MENSSRNFSEIFISGSTKFFLLDEFSNKTACVTPQNWNFEKKLDEFSSKTACVTTQKMKILEILDDSAGDCAQNSRT